MDYIGQISSNTRIRLMQFIFISMIMAYIITEVTMKKSGMIKIRYDVSEFPGLIYLTNTLKEDLDKIQKECLDFMKKPKKVKINRETGKWSDDKDFEKNIQQLRESNEWVYGWTNDNKWLNYLILSKGEFMPDVQHKFPALYEALYPHRHGFNIIGLSVLAGKSDLPQHTDPDTTFENGNLAYHFNIYCPGDYNDSGKSIITLDEGITKENIEQKSGNYLIFDPGYVHSVENKNDDQRIILYSDFDLENTSHYHVAEVVSFDAKTMDVILMMTNDTFYNWHVYNEDNGHGRMYYIGGEYDKHHIKFNKKIDHIQKYILIRLIYDDITQPNVSVQDAINAQKQIENEINA
jgi:hypothetical protein